MSFSRIVRGAALAVAVAVGAAVVGPRAAQAQAEATEIDATPKGTIGLGLIGAEVGFAVPALAGLDEWYWYVLFPAIGATGGALGGWYGIDEPGREKWAVAMLTTGMALAIPTMVLTLSMTAYDPEDEASTVEAEEVASRGSGARAAPRADRGGQAERLRRAGPGLVRRSREGWLLGAPGVAMQAVHTDKERLLLGTGRQTEVRFALLTGVF
ncbi:MAG: hypothetical protein ACODAU_05065 [Myxococcota bacterium]